MLASSSGFNVEVKVIPKHSSYIDILGTKSVDKKRVSQPEITSRMKFDGAGDRPKKSRGDGYRSNHPRNSIAASIGSGSIMDYVHLYAKVPASFSQTREFSPVRSKMAKDTESQQSPTARETKSQREPTEPTLTHSRDLPLSSSGSVNLSEDAFDIQQQLDQGNKGEKPNMYRYSLKNSVDLCDSAFTNSHKQTKPR